MSSWINGNLQGNLSIGQGERGKSIEYEWRGTELGIKQEGEEEYQFVDLAGSGAGSGREIELQVGNGYIQWRYKEEEWNNLISIDSLKGGKGDKGEQGEQGIQGPQGPKGDTPDMTAFEEKINAQYETIASEFDKAVANVTNGNENVTNSEIVQARGEEVNLNARLTKFDSQLENIANKGTTVEVLERVTKEEIDRQIADGTIANLTIEDNSVTTSKLADYSVTQEKIDPNVKLGVQIDDEATSNNETWSSKKIDSISLKVRDLLKGESVVNISGITGDKYLEALFDFTKLTAEDVKITDEKDSSKFFTLSTVEPSDSGAYALGYNGQMVTTPQSYAVGIVFRGNRITRTGIFKFNGDGNTAINYEDVSQGSGLSITHTGYYGKIFNVPLDIDTFVFLLIGIDMPNDTITIWINGDKRDTFSLGGRVIGNVGNLNKGYWADGSFIFNKIALFNKANFNDREIKAITEHVFTVSKYLNIDTSKSFLSIKNGLVRHLTMKNNTDGVIKDIVYKDIVRNTTSVNTEGFVLSERTLLNPEYSILSNGGGIFIRFDKNFDTNNQYLFNYSDTQYLWVNFSSNKICCRNGSLWVIGQREIQFAEKNVFYFDSSKKVYLNGEYVFDLGVTFENFENLIKDLKNEYPIKDYVCYVEPLNENEINTISTELSSY